MKNGILLSLAVACAGATAANAITVDGAITAGEYAGALTTHIDYSPTATGDFSSVGSASNTVGYTVFYTSDASNVYVGLQSDAASGLPFANLYFDTDAFLGSDLGFEVTNNDAFVPATGVKSLSTITGVGGAYHATAGSGSTGDVVEFSVPWTVFMTNVLGLGQPLVAPGGNLVLRTSQSFGYIPVGGTPDTYHTTRFGTLVAPSATAAVPEPASWAMMVGGFGLLGAAMRRRRTAVAFG